MSHDPVHARAPRALIRRARSDEQELRRVYREHVDAVFAFFAYSVSSADAGDLTADTFERVIRSWRRYDARKASERTWILSIARNLLVDHFRRQKHRDGTSIDEHPLLAEALLQDEPHERWMERDEVLSWLRGLSEREHHVIALRFGADLSAKDIGVLTDLSEANVHQILSRTLRKLRGQAVRTPT